MGSWFAERVKIRVLPEITIVFWKPRAIVVYSNNADRQPVLFHIPFLQKGDYVRVWKDFRRELWRRRSLTLGECTRLAERGGIIDICTLHGVDLGERPVEIRYPKWRVIGRMEKL